MLAAGDPRDLAVLATATSAGRAGAYPALRADGLLIFPTTETWGRAALRAVQCAVTDPVSFSLAEGRDRAAFPNVPGWSAKDSARRALAEHRAWLDLEQGRIPPPVRTWIGEQPNADSSLPALGMLFTAARAALFMESLAVGEPELPLTIAAVTALLQQGIADEAYECYRSCLVDQRPPLESTVSRFREAVQSLPAYSQDALVARSPRLSSGPSP
jgi:hypothetical protein